MSVAYRLDFSLSFWGREKTRKRERERCTKIKYLSISKRICLRKCHEVEMKDLVLFSPPFVCCSNSSSCVENAFPLGVEGPPQRCQGHSLLLDRILPFINSQFPIPVSALIAPSHFGTWEILLELWISGEVHHKRSYKSIQVKQRRKYN